ncbi:Concanavalin A-like lectin/glucanases superfamily protein [uncultured archaeon]|nr:Concanavalin A-like lectin/glucanases superfamily protein [uncultured archaeon]
MLAGTYNGTHVALYVDGILTQVHPASGKLSSNFINITIGSLNDISNTSFNDTLDEISIFNRSLTGTEITNIYERGILHLNLSVETCNDSTCSSPNFTNIPNDTTNQSFNLSSNQFFEYLFNFSTDNTNYSPELYNVTVGYYNKSSSDYVALTFANYFTNGINFGSVAPNTIGNNATNNSLFTITVSPDSTSTVSVCTNSSNLTSGGNTIAAGNFSYNVSIDQATLNTTELRGNFTNYTDILTSGIDGLVANSVTYWKFKLDVPDGQISGAYNGNAYFEGTNTGSC